MNAEQTPYLGINLQDYADKAFSPSTLNTPLGSCPIMG
jgi:hypothetical protein